jgi:predicted Zn finger-like uncharacterized protein
MTTTCPLCHTSSPVLSDAALNMGGAWQCARCGHHWDTVRLATAAAYAAYAEDRLGHPERTAP